MTKISLVDLRDGAELLVIGGVPRSGKTLLSARLWRGHAIAGMCFDSFVSTMVQVAPEAGVGWERNLERSHKALVAAQMIAVPSLQTFGRYFLEGEALDPLVTDALRKNFLVKACFLGLNSPRMDEIIDHEGVDAWVRNVPSDQLPALADDLAERSRQLEAQCAQLDLPFVDMSSGDYRDRVSQALTHLVDQDSRVSLAALDAAND